MAQFQHRLCLWRVDDGGEHGALRDGARGQGTQGAERCATRWGDVDDVLLFGSRRFRHTHQWRQGVQRNGPERMVIIIFAKTKQREIGR